MLKKVLVYALVYALVLGPGVSYAQPAIIADPTAPGQQQPQVLPTQGGVPQVNISTPNQNGLSYNRYQQFDVGQPGAILNNSRNSVQTQLGGWIEGNPNIRSNEANLIVNEVNSNKPSQLGGHVEVGGKRAEVVIANPSGINCDGCGFINAARGTLTTGKPQIENGNLTGYRVEGGQVNITGQGLNGHDSNYTDIIAKSVALNAGVWAEKELNVVTGSNKVKRQGTGYETEALDPGAGEITGVALDVAALGGMYAGHIKLVGTDKGLGVRNAGDMVAYAGEIVVTNDGRLENIKNISGAKGVQVKTKGDIQNSGRIQSGKDTSLSSAKNIENSGEILAEGRAEIAAGGKVRNVGLADSAETAVTAGTIENVGTGILIGDHLALAAETILNGLDWALEGKGKSGLIWARERLDIGVGDTLTNREDGLIYSGGDAFIGRYLNDLYQAEGRGGTVRNSSAVMDIAGSLSADVDLFHNLNAHYRTELRVVAEAYLTGYSRDNDPQIYFDQAEYQGIIDYLNRKGYAVPNTAQLYFDPLYDIVIASWDDGNAIINRHADGAELDYIALSAEQMARLTSDIVWLEYVTVETPEGPVQVLSPQVYLRPGNEPLLTAQGGLVSGRDVQITGDFQNAGNLLAARSLNISGEDLNNSGNIAAQFVSLAALRDINNNGGAIIGEKLVNLTAGGDINIASSTLFPALQSNPKVTSIIAIDPLTRKETVIFTR